MAATQNLHQALGFTGIN